METTWPPLPADFNDPSKYLPSSLVQFLKKLLNGKSDQSIVSSRVEWLTDSIGQDIVYGIMCGKVKTPKHSLLPFATKSLTGSTELIHILNRCGHGVSYSQTEEVDTAYVGINLLFRQRVAILCLISSGHAFRWPALGTTLIVSKKRWVELVLPTESMEPLSSKRRRAPTQVIFRPAGQIQKLRTVACEGSDPPIYNAGARVGPPPRNYMQADEKDIKYEVYKKTLIWFLARLHCSRNQTVCSWTGFNILVRNEEKVHDDVVGYLPTVNAPATQLSTVREVLRRTQQIKSSLDLKSTVVVFDQALYAKATEILWKEEDLMKDIPRMGVFHTVCTLLSIIGKRFQDAGLRDLLIESGVIAEGSVEGALEGSKYNRAVRAHKLL